MKATINLSGKVLIFPENQMEGFALNSWKYNNRDCDVNIIHIKDENHVYDLEAIKIATQSN
jgi:hypothetical protein